MIEVSALLFSLLIEGLVALLVVLLAGVFVLIKRKRKDTAAAKQLVDQIKHQSDARIKQMGAYLTEKYQLEGEELSEAIKLIDKSEKRFFQRLINMYLKRDSESVKSIDAWLAELVETYKSFQPAQPDEPKETGVSMEEFQQLQQTNENLRQELEITKDTMGNMIAEFGNMFGGGADTKLDDDQVVEKVSKKPVIDDEPIVEPEDGFVVGGDFVVQEDEQFAEVEELEDDDLIADIEPVEESDMAAELMAEMDAELNPASDLAAELEAEVAMSEADEASSEQYLEDELLAELGIEPELDSKPDTQEAADAMVAELEAEIATQEEAEIDDIFEEAQSKAQAEVESEGEAKEKDIDIDDVTGIDIGSEEDIDKLLEDMDLSRDK